MSFTMMLGAARPPGLATALALAIATGAAAGCGESVTGPQAESCGEGPYFTVLPIADADLAEVSVFGGLGAPGHTLPTPHAGMFLAREDVPLRSPGDLAVTELRRVTYVSSPGRQGERDFAIFFQVCEELTGWFGHVVTLGSAIPSDLDWKDCQTYSTAEETVEACETGSLDIKVAAGAALGTGGLSAEPFYLAVDFGMLDDRVDNFYVAPERLNDPSLHAVCPWEQFDAANREILFSKLRDGVRPGIAPQGEPRCGTMAVDVAGTAKGVWAETGVSGRVQGDERRYMTLANYPYRPEDELALSLGSEALGARVAVVPRRASGRVNRPFEQVTADGLIYCYSPADATSTDSWFLRLSAPAALQIERISHAAGASPCEADPSTWSFGAAAVSMVR
jgi:hypothetical protein